MKKISHTPISSVQKIFPKIVIVLLFIIVCITYYYWAKTHEFYGLKRFVSFQLPYCKEPLIEPTVNQNSFYNSQEAYENITLGYTIWKPQGWTVSKDNCDYGAAECLNSPDLKFPDNGSPVGARLVVHRVNQSHDFMRESFYDGSEPKNIFSYMAAVFSCRYTVINGLHTVVAAINKPLPGMLYFFDTGKNIFILEPKVYGGDPSEQVTLSKMIESFQGSSVDQEGNMGPYNGTPSSQVPYKNLNFQDIDIYKIRQVQGELTSAASTKGFTFTALQGDAIVFTALEPSSINQVLFTTMELYSYGPTVLRAASRLDMKVPVSGRYFLVVKGIDTNSFGKYQLRIDINH